MAKSTKTSYILSDGVVVETSTRRDNRTGYTGAALSPAWTLNANKPFIAACGNPTDSSVMAVVNAQARTSLHLGAYSDAREAAYVIGRYRKDPISTILTVQSNGAWDEFPSDLYDLPEGLAYEKAVEILETARRKRKIKTTVIAKDITVQASGNLYNFFKHEQILTVAKAKGGPVAFQAYLVGKTIADFASDNGLAV
jgi:hypothetical protein